MVCGVGGLSLSFSFPFSGLLFCVWREFDSAWRSLFLFAVVCDCFLLFGFGGFLISFFIRFWVSGELFFVFLDLRLFMVVVLSVMGGFWLLCWTVVVLVAFIVFRALWGWLVMVFFLCWGVPVYNSSGVSCGWVCTRISGSE